MDEERVELVPADPSRKGTPIPDHSQVPEPHPQPAEQIAPCLPALVESAPLAMVLIDRCGKIAFVNAETEGLFGYGREELLGQLMELLVPERIRSEHVELRTEFLAHPVTRRMGVGRDLTGRRKDGSELPIEIGLTAVTTDSSTFVLGTIIDITERKQAEEALRKSNSELEQFAYAASHDLQEPLRKILAYGELLREECGESLSVDGRDYLDIMVNGAQRLKVLIRDLLSFARITTRGNPLVATDADACLQIALDNLEVAIQECAARITSDPLPVVMADESQLVLLFQNLVGNAIKYCDETVPVVHIGVRDLGDQCAFAVQDNGIGIEAQFHERVFQIFQRLHNRREYSGTGIGLALCKRIVERFGGKIWVESAPGGGSRFCFTVDRSGPQVDL